MAYSYRAIVRSATREFAVKSSTDTPATYYADVIENQLNQLVTASNPEISRLSRVPIVHVAECEAPVSDGAAVARPRTYDDRAQDGSDLNPYLDIVIRGATDKGCFVILQSATPSRLLTAFPPEAPVSRCGLAEAVREIRAFLSP